MTMTQKQEIAAAARKLIGLLDDCDDPEFVDEVINCVFSNDTSSIDEDEL